MTVLNTAPSADAKPGTGTVLLAAEEVRKSFGREGTPVLDGVSLELREGEFVALLGPSGSGKSTLLRILAGLVQPSDGSVLVRGAPLEGLNRQVAIVFQNFALFPWLTVLQNVELGLLSTELPQSEKRERATKAIDLIGLDGFEEAFPKELSGGMKQRVGFARALVVQPEILFMDEPFSALDVLTGENLRTEFQAMWLERSIPTKAVLMVTHNIDEAVALADRILVFGANPGHIRVELPGVPTSERHAKSGARAALVDTIYRIMTEPDADAVAIAEEAALAAGGVRAPAARKRPTKRARSKAAGYQRLPDVSVDDLTGFVQYLGGIGGQANLSDLGRDLQVRADDLLSLVEACDLLGFVDLKRRVALLTELGSRFAGAELDEEKALFRAAVSEQVSLIRFITRALEDEPSHSLEAQFVLDELEFAFRPKEARQQLETAIDWGRYAELFTYDHVSGEFRLDEEHRLDASEPDVTDVGKGRP
jgi:NitT/TauT family transport system ATP-binding protein